MDSELEPTATSKTRAAAVLDPSRPPVPIPARLLAEVYEHARECYPEECCGLLLGPPCGSPVRIVRCTNVQSRRKLEGESDLDAQHGFWIDEGELLRTLREAEDEGEDLLLVYHSHVNTGAYLSHADLAGALGPDGAPLWARVAQLVVSVYEGGVREAVCFRWEDATEGFVGHPVERVSA